MQEMISCGAVRKDPALAEYSVTLLKQRNVPEGRAHEVFQVVWESLTGDVSRALARDLETNAAREAASVTWLQGMVALTGPFAKLHRFARRLVIDETFDFSRFEATARESESHHGGRVLERPHEPRGPHPRTQ
jgi:hypothetical protein